MYYELEILDSLVLNKLNPSSNIPLLEDYYSIALTEGSAIRDNLYKSVFEIKDKELIKIYICRHQKQLIKLADILHSYLVLNEQKSDTQATTSTLLIWESTLHVVEDLLVFIVSHFSDYLNPADIIPKRLRFNLITQSREYITYINQFNNPSTSKLIEIATNTLQDIIENQEKTTYTQLFYIENLTKQFLGFEKQTKYTDYAIYLRNRLFYINFNALTFVYYLTDEIQRVINSLETEQEKTEKLLWYHKYINQHHIDPELAYNPKVNSIKHLLLQFLEDEIYYRKVSPVPTQEDNLASNHLVKFETILSVDQYALLVSAIFESGAYINISKTKFSNGCARITITKGSANVSTKNMRNKMYAPTLQDIELVKKLVINMLNYLRGLNMMIILLYFFRDYNFLEFYITPLAA